VRYVGQEYSLTIPVSRESEFTALVDHFQDVYHGRYGHSSPGAGIELVALRASAGKPFDTRGAQADAEADTAALGTQLVHFVSGAVETPVYHRDAVVELEGPALILEATSTTVVPPSWRAVRLPAGHMLLERKSA
jgi:N-methylhydantoinase A/oxoprolinase/acetone carboxylase beta subunit